MYCRRIACKAKVMHNMPADYNGTCHSGQNKVEKQTPAGLKSTCKAMGQANATSCMITLDTASTISANLHTHTHTQHCTGHAPLPVTAPEQEQQNLHRDLMLPWYSQSHHHRRRRRLAVDRAMTALLAAWQQRCMHAVTVHMGHSWRLHMHSLQQIQGLRCSQKLLQGQARVYSGLC
jgi:hypothetical protein